MVAVVGIEEMVKIRHVTNPAAAATALRVATPLAKVVCEVRVGGRW